MKEKTNLQKIFEESIVLNGPMGSGKTVISTALAEITGMPVVHLDVMRFLQSEEMIEWEIEHEEDEEEIKRLKFLLANRKFYPEFKNFWDFGYSADVSREYGKLFGTFGKFVYKKQFDSMLLEEFLRNIKEPCIIDMGGTMGVSLEEKSKNLLEIISKENPKLVSDSINFDYMGFKNIQDFLGRFANVIELTLPEDWREKGEKASRGELNSEFIESGEYSKTATESICVEDLVMTVEGKSQLNFQRVSEIVGLILDSRMAKNVDKVAQN